ncbi:CD1107 family mobile element protein [Faecalibacterium prausnitzii]|uniref:DUF4366 domain-containing protein n=1 Tax=Faecalibacterium prausnitzii TaxID=853 RepID=A0A3E2TTP2_9FIRM|nr:DUF4366 domain-containing protein [Faecalibacterium prausnitzii]
MQMKIKKLGALLVSVALCAGMAAPAFAYGGEPVEEVEQPVLTSTTDEEDVVTVTDEETGALTPEGNLTLVDDYHTDYSDGSGQQFITLVSKSGATFYLVIDRNAKGQQTVHFMNLVDEADLLSLMEEEEANAYTAFEKPSVVQLEQIFTIDKSRVQRFLGRLTQDEMQEIEKGVVSSLDLNELFFKIKIVSI